MSESRSEYPAADGEKPISQRTESVGWLSVGQFFLGGLVLFIVAIVFIYGYYLEYDGIFSIFGLRMGGIDALTVAVVSMIAAFLIGLPLRLVPAL